MRLLGGAFVVGVLVGLWGPAVVRAGAWWWMVRRASRLNVATLERRQMSVREGWW